MYKVIKGFTDLQDDGHIYRVGDEFPREGIKVSATRLAKLAGEANRQGVPLIKEVATGVNNPVKTPAQPEVVVQETSPKKVARQATKKESGTQPKKRTAAKKKD